jgi:hypothetical protein
MPAERGQSTLLRHAVTPSPMAQHLYVYTMSLDRRINATSGFIQVVLAG